MFDLFTFARSPRFCPISPWRCNLTSFLIFIKRVKIKIIIDCVFKTHILHHRQIVQSHTVITYSTKTMVKTVMMTSNENTTTREYYEIIEKKIKMSSKIWSIIIVHDRSLVCSSLFDLFELVPPFNLEDVIRFPILHLSSVKKWRLSLTMYWMYPKRITSPALGCTTTQNDNVICANNGKNGDTENN